MFDLIKNIFTCKRSKKGVGKYVISFLFLFENEYNRIKMNQKLMKKHILIENQLFLLLKI